MPISTGYSRRLSLNFNLSTIIRKTQPDLELFEELATLRRKGGTKRPSRGGSSKRITRYFDGDQKSEEEGSTNREIQNQFDFKKMWKTVENNELNNIPEPNYDYQFKLLLIGNSAVGKTSFLLRYVDDAFAEAFIPTVGIDFKVKTIKTETGKRVKLQIWDTAGQERYRTITTAYYRGAMGFIIMYDITNEESFNAVQDWLTQIKTNSLDSAQIVLVGNKSDSEGKRVIPYERGKEVADQLAVEFIETSAKEAFASLVDVICSRMSQIDGANSNSVNSALRRNFTLSSEESQDAIPQKPNSCSC